MNILHYFLGFPPFHSGGLMIYARDLAKQQLKNGNTVLMLMPGKYDPNKNKSSIKFYKNENDLPVYQIINGLPFSDSGISEPNKFMLTPISNNYEDFLVKNKIEVVHIHSLIGLPKQFVEVAKRIKIKTCFTSHDYFGLCPIIKLINYKSDHCVDYSSGLDCVRCNFYCNNDLLIQSRNNKLRKFYPLLIKIYQNSKIRNTYRCMRNVLKKNNVERTVLIKNLDSANLRINEKNKAIEYEKLRSFYIEILNKIDVFLFNSSVAMNVYGDYIDLNKKDVHIIPVTHGNIKDNRSSARYCIEKKGKTHFSFMGYLNKEKGFIDLVETLDLLKESQTNWEISIYGDYSKIEINGFDNRFYKFKGTYNHNELSNIFSSTDILIIPSKWKETFGFTGLEAMSYGIPVIASNNVGFSDLIEDNLTGFIYKDDHQNIGLMAGIKKILDDPDIINKFKTNLKANKFNYTIEKHADSILKIYRY